MAPLILAGDVGGTKTVLATFEYRNGELNPLRVYFGACSRNSEGRPLHRFISPRVCHIQSGSRSRTIAILRKPRQRAHDNSGRLGQIDIYQIFLNS